MKKSSFSKKELLDIADGINSGENSGKLPLPPMLMFDRIKEISETGGKYNKGQIVAEMDIKPSHWFFECHFKDDPVMPGCLGLDALWQLTGFYLSWAGGVGKGRALGCDEVKFKGQIRPHHKMITYRVDIKKVIKKPIFMAITDAIVELGEKDIYSAQGLRVGLFQNLNYPPPDGEMEPF